MYKLSVQHLNCVTNGRRIINSTKRTINPLTDELFVAAVIEIEANLDHYSLPTHRRDTRIELFPIFPSYLKLKLWANKTCLSLKV